MRLDARVPEPELMEDPRQARAYSEADFSAPHQAVVDALVTRHPHLRARSLRAIDIGCGPGDVTVRLASALPMAEVVGIDAGSQMLALGEQRVTEHGLGDRVQLLQLHLPASRDELTGLGRFDVVVSNAMLHHLDDPHSLWSTVRAVAGKDAVIHVVDLRRPEDDDAVDALTARHAMGEPPVLVEDFRASLRAAYRADEIREQLRTCGLDDTLTVESVGDRHLVVSGTFA
jgi:2-polyprenyl-3-methyl-5-hydroxy-6-metoxy-1,4-benzoquinol methylase